MMHKIHDFMDLPRNFKLRGFGTQEYEADVVILEREGELAAACVCLYVCMYVCMYVCK